MESSLTLATESFSYSWLSSSSCKSTTTTPLEPNCQNFNFDISFLNNPSPNSSCVVAYADELFSGGTIKPLFVLHPNNSKLDYLDKTNNKPTSSSSSNNSRDLRSPTHHHNHHGLFTRWKASTRRTFNNISRRIGRLSRKVVCSGKIVSVIDDDIDIDNHNNKKKERQVKRSSITVHPVIGAFHDSHLENSIYEAVLHCKRSKIEEKKNCTSFARDMIYQVKGMLEYISGSYVPDVNICNSF